MTECSLCRILANDVSRADEDVKDAQREMDRAIDDYVYRHADSKCQSARASAIDARDRLILHRQGHR
jgi:hypothetical protein